LEELESDTATSGVNSGQLPPSTDKRTESNSPNILFKTPQSSSKKRRIPNGGKNLNYIQINTNKAKRATDDLVLFAKKFCNSLVLTKELYVNGKNSIPSPAAEF
jgi:hypothetical protein